jgi:hypothetical protein
MLKMISIKGAKFTICGIAGLWLVNKLINAGGSIFQKVLDERKWHAYYKYGQDSQHIVPPGYASTIVPHETYDVKYASPEEQEDEEKKKAEASKPSVDFSGLADSAKRLVDAYMKVKFGNKNNTGDTDRDEQIVESEEAVEKTEDEVEDSKPVSHIHVVMPNGDEKPIEEDDDE